MKDTDDCRTIMKELGPSPIPDPEDKPTMNARLMYLIMKQYVFYDEPYRWEEDSDD